MAMVFPYQRDSVDSVEPFWDTYRRCVRNSSGDNYLHNLRPHRNRKTPMKRVSWGTLTHIGARPPLLKHPTNRPATQLCVNTQRQTGMAEKPIHFQVKEVSRPFIVVYRLMCRRRPVPSPQYLVFPLGSHSAEMLGGGSKESICPHRGMQQTEAKTRVANGKWKRSMIYYLSEKVYNWRCCCFRWGRRDGDSSRGSSIGRWE